MKKNSIKKIVAAGMVAVMSIGFGSAALAAYTSYGTNLPNWMQHKSIKAGTKSTNGGNAYHTLDLMGGGYDCIRVWIDNASGEGVTDAHSSYSGKGEIVIPYRIATKPSIGDSLMLKGNNPVFSLEEVRADGRINFN